MRAKRSAINLLVLGNVSTHDWQHGRTAKQIFVYLVESVIAGRLELPLEVESDGDPFSDRLSVGPEAFRLAYYRKDLPPELFRRAADRATKRRRRKHSRPKRFRDVFYSLAHIRALNCQKRRDWEQLVALVEEVQLDPPARHLRLEEWLTTDELHAYRRRERADARRPSPSLSCKHGFPRNLSRARREIKLSTLPASSYC